MSIVIRISEAARTLGISRATLYRWIDRGLIDRPLQIGPRTVGWQRSYIDQFIANRPTVARP